MNVFKKKAKAKDDSYIIPPAIPSDSAPPAKQSRSLKRKQKNVVEPVPKIDLATVLPDKTDFRTSLLMPGLSARFSMLREQDDPNTKVGKASDDSVLFPKRASRLNLFAHNPLSDIAETESIRTAFRAPFSDDSRSHSFSEGGGYASDDGSNLLSRPRPTEGNNFFGGRQKMYRIPTANGSGSAKDLTDSPAPLTAAKHVYQNDVAISPFQQMRIKAMEEQELAQSDERSSSLENDRSSVVNTPSTGFSKSRGTTSSTASGPSNRRISTAATSVVSDSPHLQQSNISASSNAKPQAVEFGSEESLLKRNFSSESRRAFAGADTQGQPPLPISPISGRQLPQSKSVTNLSEKYGRVTSPFSTNTPRATSPPPAIQTQALASLDFGLKSPTSQSRRYQTASPTNEDDEGDVYNRSLQPNDRGKATAMGLFNRPQQQFDEQKFEERQLQMHGGRVSPPSSDGPEYSGSTDPHMDTGRPVLPSVPTSPVQKGFQRGRDSSTSVPTRSRAHSVASSVTSAQVSAHAEALIKRQNEEYSVLQAQQSPPKDLTSAASVRSPNFLTSQPPASRGTFFNTFDGSDEDDTDNPMLGRYEPPPRLTPLEVHPALRDGSQTFDFGEQVSPLTEDQLRPQSNASGAESSPSVVEDGLDTNSLHRHSSTKAKDSPTLGMTTGLGLSGLIRTHLRHDSDRSSVMPPPSPAFPPNPSGFSSSLVHGRQSSISTGHAGNYGFGPRERERPAAPTKQGNYPTSPRIREPSIASTARTIDPPESTHSDPWEFDNAHRAQRSPLEPIHNEALPSMSQKAQQILGQAVSHRAHATSKAQQLLGDDAPMPMDERSASRAWQHEVLSHSRGESTETQKEFGNELAERARKIQEGLKGTAEAEKRSRSQDHYNPATQALHAMRHKTSKTSMLQRGTEPQPKAMKMLGLGNGPRPDAGLRSPNMSNRRDGGRDGEFDHRPHEAEHRFHPRETPTDFDPNSGRRTPGFARPGPHPSHSNEEVERPYQQRSATPNGGRSRRDRAESEAAARSRSRPGQGRYGGEPPYSPPEFGRPGPNQGPSHREQQRPYGHPDASNSYRGPRGPSRGPPQVDARNYERSASSMSNRQPNGAGPRPGPGRGAGPSGYFDDRVPTPTMGSTPQLSGGPIPSMGQPRASPRPPYPHSPISPFVPQPGLSPALSGPHAGMPPAMPSPSGPLPHVPNSGRFTPAEGRSTPIGGRKRSVTKGMISEPTFISSTSSVPLVGLPSGPRPVQIASPPLPTMNPRRRGNTMSAKPEDYPSPRLQADSRPASPSRGPMGMPATPNSFTDHNQHQGFPEKYQPRPRNRLRKISSEGGSMAARARNQAMMAEFGHERLRSPALPVFPNRSATSLSMRQDGGMF